MTNFLCSRLHAARANIRNNKNFVIFIFVIAVEHEINFTSKISRTTVYENAYDCIYHMVPNIAGAQFSRIIFKHFTITIFIEKKIQSVWQIYFKNI